MRYAANTGVSVEKSKAEIERTLTCYGANQFAYVWRDEGAMIGFCMNGKMLRFLLPMPSRTADEFAKSPTGRRRKNQEAILKAWEQATRQRWRALALLVKAKLEAVHSGITIFEEEFLAHIVLPGTSGMTMGQMSLPRIERAYKTGETVGLLEWGGKITNEAH